MSKAAIALEEVSLGPGKWYTTDGRTGAVKVRKGPGLTSPECANLLNGTEIRWDKMKPFQGKWRAHVCEPAEYEGWLTNGVVFCSSQSCGNCRECGVLPASSAVEVNAAAKAAVKAKRSSPAKLGGGGFGGFVGNLANALKSGDWYVIKPDSIMVRTGMALSSPEVQHCSFQNFAIESSILGIDTDPNPKTIPSLPLSYLYCCR